MSKIRKPRLGLERIYKKDVVRESMPINSKSLFTYGKTPAEVLNMIERPEMKNIRDIKPVPIPDVAETKPAPILAPTNWDDNIESWKRRADIAGVEEDGIKRLDAQDEADYIDELINERVNSMPIKNVVEINEKIDKGERLSKYEEKLIAPTNSSLLQDIRKGIQLKKIEQKEDPIKDNKSLQDILKEEFEKRRKDIKGNGLILGGKIYDKSQIKHAQLIMKNMNYKNNFY